MIDLTASFPRALLHECFTRPFVDMIHQTVRMGANVQLEGFMVAKG
jgi:hypothetical protein